MSQQEKDRVSGEIERPDEPMLPVVDPEKVQPPKPSLPASFYVVAWIAASSAVILFNKWILDTKEFKYPILLTSWHLAFGTFMTQVLARTTTLLDGRHKVKMTGRVYLRAIVPIGFFFSLSLICGNVSYLYLSVSFIQMLKATTPVMTLFATWALGLKEPNLQTLANISAIVVGVMIAAYGEIQFVLFGFVIQMAGIVFEATRLVMVERLLSGSEFKMDPLVSFYYFAPICAVMNGVIALFLEVPSMKIDDIFRVGVITLLLNAMTAFALNVALVTLIGKTSSLVLTLCGVLKDILLVAASIIIFGSPVTFTQWFGYSIALGGLVYYKLGAQQIKGHLSDGARRWSEFGVSHPAQRKMVVFGAVAIFIFLLLGGVGYQSGYDPKAVVSSAKSAVGAH